MAAEKKVVLLIIDIAGKRCSHLKEINPYLNSLNVPDRITAHELFQKDNS